MTRARSSIDRDDIRCCVCSEPLRTSYFTNVWGRPYHSHHATCYWCDRPMPEGRQQACCRICHATRVTDLHEAVRRSRLIIDLLRLRRIEVPQGVVHFRLRVTPKPGTDNLGLATLRSTTAPSGSDGTRDKIHTVTIKRGLPAVRFDATVAHELTHVAFHIGDIRATEQVNEGVAELQAVWLLGRIGGSSAAALQQRIVTNADPIYGGGYRLVRRAEDRFGWPAVWAQLRRDGRLPR